MIKSAGFGHLMAAFVRDSGWPVAFVAEIQVGLLFWSLGFRLGCCFCH